MDREKILKYSFFTLVAGIILFFGLREAYLHVSLSLPEEQAVPANEMVETLDSLMGDYHKTRDILTIPTILNYLSKLNTFEYGKHKAAVIGFLTGLLHQEGRDHAKYWKKLKISRQAKKAVDIALLVEPKIDELLDSDESLKDIKSIDFYWGYFAATYDMRCIKLIIKTKNDEKLPKEVREAAQRSLEYNRMRHDF